MNDHPSIPDERDLLRTYLQDRDVPCPACGYNVRNLTATRCPECGEELALRLAMVEPKQAAIVTGLVGLSAAAGLNGLLLIYAAIVILLIRPGSGGLERFLIINSIGFTVSGITLIVWIRSWKRLRLMNPLARRLLAIACWGFAVADVVLFAIFIR